MACNCSLNLLLFNSRDLPRPSSNLLPDVQYFLQALVKEHLRIDIHYACHDGYPQSSILLLYD